MQPHPRPGQPGVDVGAGVVQPPTRRRRKALREPAHRVLVVEHHLGPLQARAPVHPHRARPGDQHIRDPRLAQQRIERARPYELALQRAHRREHVRVPDHPARLGADRRRELPDPRLATRGGQAHPHPLHQVHRRHRCCHRCHPSPPHPFAATTLPEPTRTP